MNTDVTIGIDIGTTSVKAVAADPGGHVVTSARVPHRLLAAHAGELAHDAAAAWCDGVTEALARVTRSDVTIRAVNTAAMVPSLCAVDDSGRPVSVGLLYGDKRGAGDTPVTDPAGSGEFLRFLGWLSRQHPQAAGYWPAQAVANAALGGTGVLDSVTAMTTFPLFDHHRWDPEVSASAGVPDVSRLPRLHAGSGPIGEVSAAGDAPLGPGTVDALAEQLVAGADRPGDVLVILGSTLVVWAVKDRWYEVPGLWTVPHHVRGATLIGGASNAGGLFVNWVKGLLGPLGSAQLEPERVPVWQPYARGERVPFHDPDRRASLHGLDIGMGPAPLHRAAYEASGFVVRHLIDLGGGGATRIVATGGGVRDEAWIQAIADATDLPLDVVSVPEGGALGAAFLARLAAGLERSTAAAAGWVGVGRRVEPDPRWRRAVDARYEQYRSLAG